MGTFARAAAADRGCTADGLGALLRENRIASMAPVYDSMGEGGVQPRRVRSRFAYDLLIIHIQSFKMLCQNERVDLSFFFF